MRLEQPQFPDALSRDSTGCKIGDASARELQPHVCDIHFFRKYLNTRRADLVELPGASARTMSMS